MRGSISLDEDPSSPPLGITTLMSGSTSGGMEMVQIESSSRLRKNGFSQFDVVG